MQLIPSKYRKLVLVCTNLRDNGRESCGAKGSAEIHAKLKAAMSAADPLVRVSKTGCLGNCETGITVVIMPDNKWFGAVKESDIPAIVKLVTEGKATVIPDSDGDFLGM